LLLSGGGRYLIKTSRPSTGAEELELVVSVKIDYFLQQANVGKGKINEIKKNKTV
jgi:hypothetical protein